MMALRRSFVAVADHLLPSQTGLRRRAARYDDPSRASWRTRVGRRRIAVEGLIAACAATVALAAAGHLLGGHANLGLAASALVWYRWIDRLLVSTRGVTQLPVSMLDERQRSARAQAYERAYRVMLLVLLAVPLAAVLDQLVGIDARGWVILGVAGVVIGLAAPPVLLALAEPDDPIDGDD